MIQVSIKDGFSPNKWTKFWERFYPIWEEMDRSLKVKRLNEDCYLCSDELGEFIKDISLNIYKNYDYLSDGENWNIRENLDLFPLEFESLD